MQIQKLNVRGHLFKVTQVFGGRIGTRSRCLSSNPMFISLFIQQIFIELLCARHFLGTKDIAVNKMNKVSAFPGVTFQFGETNKQINM